MSDEPVEIPGFTRHGRSYRQHVTLPEADALDVRAEADARAVPVGIVLRDRVSRVLRRVGTKPSGPPLAEWTGPDGTQFGVWIWKAKEARR